MARALTGVGCATADETQQRQGSSLDNDEIFTLVVFQGPSPARGSSDLRREPQNKHRGQEPKDWEVQHVFHSPPTQCPQFGDVQLPSSMALSAQRTDLERKMPHRSQHGILHRAALLAATKFFLYDTMPAG